MCEVDGGSGKLMSSMSNIPMNIKGPTCMAKSNCKLTEYQNFRLHQNGDNMNDKSGSKARKNQKGKNVKGSWVIGGTTMIGLGVGFFLLPISALYFVASILIGIGTGLVLAPIISGKAG